jgi:hypothetical protein
MDAISLAKRTAESEVVAPHTSLSCPAKAGHPVTTSLGSVYWIARFHGR